MNGTLACAVTAAEDRDSVTNCNGTTYANDGVRYTWSAFPGGFHRGTDVNGKPIIAPEAFGPSASYMPPKDFIGRASISCVIDDEAKIPNGDGGWRDDDALYRSCSVLVKGDKLQVNTSYHYSDQAAVLEADGRDSGVITIHGDHDDGAAGGMTVTLSTTLGTITPTTVRLDQYGNSNARLTAGIVPGVAVVTGRLNQATGTAKVAMYRLKVTGTPQMLTYDPESSEGARRAPVISSSITCVPPIAKKLEVWANIHTLKHGEALNTKQWPDLAPGSYNWQWSEFFVPEAAYVPGMGPSPDPGRGLYPYQVTARVTELDAAWLKSAGIVTADNESNFSYYFYGAEESRSSKSLQTTWTQAKIGYNEAAARTELAYTFRIYNVRRAAPPKACRLDIYDPDFSIVKTVSILTADFVPVAGLANTFQVDKVVPFQPGSAGDYHFVVEAQQSDHIDEGRDAGKWALERNQNKLMPTYFVSTTQSPGLNDAGVPGMFDSRPAGAAVKGVLEKIGYSAQSPAVQPWWVPNRRGVHNNVGVETAVGYEASDEASRDAHNQTMQYNAVCTYIGHGTISRLENGQIPRAIGRRMMFNSEEPNAPSASYLTTNDWVKEAYIEKADYVAMMNMPNARVGVNGAQTDKPFYAVRLAAFFGCNTSYAYPNRANTQLETLTEVAHRQGARSAIGLRGELKVWQISKFAESFYFYLGKGQTASAAMFAAIDDAQMHGKDTMGVFDMGADIAGDYTVKLDGPKWGRDP